MRKLRLPRKRDHKKIKAWNMTWIVVNFVVNRLVSRRSSTIRMFTYKESS